MPGIESPAIPIVSQLRGLHLFHVDGAPCARAAAMALVERAKVLHLSIRYVTFHWGLSRLAMLNRFFRAKAMIDNALGKGLSQALNKALAA